MKYLNVSDYDGTLKIKNQDDVTIKNIEKLQLLNLKSKLLISTGRLYNSIKNEIEQFNIPFNYISCANGNILFDKNFNVMYKTNIDSKIDELLKPFYKEILNVELLDEYGQNVIKKSTEYVVYLKEKEQIRRKFVNMLSFSSIFDYCTDGNNRFMIHIFSLSNKIKTIGILKEKLNLLDNSIYTIGDGSNDIDMISKYNGFIVGNNLDNFEQLHKIPRFDTFSSCAEEIQKVLRKEL